MPLRYLTRRVGIRALRRASGSRVTPPARDRSLTRGSAQGRCSYGVKRSEGLAANGYGKGIDTLEAKVQAVREATRLQKIHRRCLMASAAAGVGLGLLLASASGVRENV